MKKLKYLFITLMIALVGFLAFSIRNYLPVLALGNVSFQDNDTFSSDLLIDMDYYNSLDDKSINLFNVGNISLDSAVTSYSFAVDSGNLTFNTSAGNSWQGVRVTINVEPLKKYKFYYTANYNDTFLYSVTDNNNNILYNANLWGSGNVFSYDFTTLSNTTSVTFRFSNMTNTNNNVLQRTSISYSSLGLYLFSDYNSTFVPYYKNMFGFSITSDSVLNIAGLDYVETILNKNYYYLPFDISENGKISLNHTFPVGDIVSINKIVVNNRINGVVNNKLKLSYYYSNFSLGYKSITFADDSPSANETWYGLIFESSPPQVILQSGKSSVYYSNWKSGIYNFISQSDFIDVDDPYYSQVLGFGSYADSGNGKRTISFESLVCSSFGSGGGTYIPDNPSNDYESYLPVSGPFDLVPILTNAFTWIIYHVPIIGPIVNLFRSARVMFTSVVSLGELFSGFGIIFSIFIICLILYIIKKLYGGDN